MRGLDAYITSGHYSASTELIVCPYCHKIWPTGVVTEYGATDFVNDKELECPHCGTFSVSAYDLGEMFKAFKEYKKNLSKISKSLSKKNEVELTNLLAKFKDKNEFEYYEGVTVRDIREEISLVYENHFYDKMAEENGY